MKVLKWMVLSMCIFIAFQSCSESNDELMLVASQQNVKTKLIDMERSYFVMDDGALRFESVDAYYSLNDSLRQLTEDEFEAWEKEVGFSSYRTYFKNILISAMDMDSDAIKDVVNSNSGCIYIDSNDMIQPVVGAQFFQNVISKNRYFYIADNKYIVDGSFVVTENQITKSVVDKVQYTCIKEGILALASDDEVTYPSITYTAKGGDRQVITWLRIYKHRLSTPINPYQIIMEISVRPRKYNHFGGYKDYNDWCYVEELRVHMPGLGMTIYTDENGNTVMGKDRCMYLKTVSSSKETPIFTSSYGLGQNNGERLQDPVCVHYRARTGDLGKYGAAYNSYHPLPGMDSSNCGDRLVTEYQHVIY